MEKAIHEVGNTFLAKTEHWHEDWELIREYPLDLVICLAAGAGSVAVFELLKYCFYQKQIKPII
jgi:hypothetical protein